MFGLSFGEVVLLCVIALVVIGPRNMPQAMRSLGKMVAKARRMTTDLREQSGIDEILRDEGIEKEMAELRKIATGRILDVNLYDDEAPAKRWDNPPRNREYPLGGVDSYGALGESASPYLIATKKEQEGRVARGAVFEDEPPAHALPEPISAEIATTTGAVPTPAETPDAKVVSDGKQPEGERRSVDG